MGNIVIHILINYMLYRFSPKDLDLNRSMSDNGSAARIIASASGGRALRGLSLQHVQVGDRAAHPTFTFAIANQMLLRPPSDVLLMSPSKPSLSIAYCFSASQQSESFSKDVIDNGWTFAIKAHAEFLLWSASASAQGSRHDQERREEHDQRKVSEAYILHCVFVPTKSFQITSKQMVLSDAALDKARAISTAIDAQDFLGEFHPFVSQGLYHVGGVFLKEVSLKLREEASLSDLLTQTQNELRGNIEAANVLSAKGGAGGGAEGSQRTNTSLQVQQRIENVQICGPTIAQTSLEDFHRIMAMSDPSYWAVIDLEQSIDGDGSQNLIPVWELLVKPPNNPALNRAAKLLCEHWIQLENLSVGRIRHPLRSNLMTRANLFLQSQQLVHDPMPSREQPPALDLGGHSDVSLANLVQTLQQFIDSKGVDEVTVMDQIQRFIRGKSTTTVGRADKSPTEHDSRALAALRRWGFDLSTGIHLQLESGVLHDDLNIRSILEDLLAAPSQSHYEPIGSVPWRNVGNHMGAFWPRDNVGNSASTLRYVGDVVVDRNNEYLLTPPSSQYDDCNSTLTPAQRYIDCLRHRINPREQRFLDESQTTEAVSKEKDWDWDAACASDEDESSDHADEDIAEETQPSHILARNISLLELLVDIFQRSELPAQAEVCRLLLSQRASTLLVFPRRASTTAWNGSDGNFHHCIESFRFLKVVVQDEKKVCIQKDVELPRVVFVSEEQQISKSHSATVASKVMQCDFLSQHDRSQMDDHSRILPAIEVGVGFIRSEDCGSPTPCLCFHVTGPYRQYPEILEFIKTIADIVLLERGKGDIIYAQEMFWGQKSGVENCAKVLQWQETDGDEKSDVKRMLIWGQESYIVRQIKRALLSIIIKIKKASTTRISLTEACTRFFSPPVHDLINAARIDEVLGTQSPGFSDIRGKLILQKSFVKEGEAVLASLQLISTVIQRHAKERIRDQQRQWRKRNVNAVKDLPVIQMFHQILSQGNSLCRTLGMWTLETSISEGMREALAGLAWDVDTKYKAYACAGRGDDQRLKKEYVKKQQEYIDKSVGIDNLWRELCHIFEADPEGQRNIATLAAQHLQDGFPLEIFDGDAGIYCQTWVGTVLTELHSILSKAKGAEPRLFVLSVMGLQSSGKSTMLNLMFGTRLPTSAGRCTRGVYIQLVPSTRAEYDYVLLLDTEGLRSNEFHGIEGSEVRDNRLATFGILPADASILMVSNEDDSALKEVLPMVFLAFKSSSMAEECGGKMKAKMVFVYRSVDINQKSKLEGNKRKLRDNLREAEKEVSRLVAGEASTEN